MKNKNKNLERKIERDWKDWIPISGLFRYGLIKPLGKDRFKGNESYYFGYLAYQMVSIGVIIYTLKELIQ